MQEKVEGKKFPTTKFCVLRSSLAAAQTAGTKVPGSWDFPRDFAD